MTWMALAALAAIMAAHLLDDSATLFVQSSQSPLIYAMREITDIGLSKWYLTPAAFLFIGIAFVDWDAQTRSGRSRLALLFSQAGYAFAAIALAASITNVLKFLVGRARPDIFDQGGSLHFEPFAHQYDLSSFPSGHSTNMGAVALVLMLWFPKVRIPIFILCAFASFTRVAARAHYPSDVVAGFALGLLAALFLARWLARRRVAFRFRNNELLPVPRFRLLPRRPRGQA